jgi:uncharacterized protein YndB with AHSA1/START domain
MRVQASIAIHRPVETVFTCMTSSIFIHQWLAPLRSEKDDLDLENQSHGMRSTAHKPELRQVPEGAIGVGTTFLQSNESSSNPLEATLEVVEYKYPTIFTLEIMLGTHKSRIAFTFKPISDDTQVTFQLRPKRQRWFVKVVDTIISFTQSSSGNTPYNLQHIKKYVEEQC